MTEQMKGKLFLSLAFVLAGSTVVAAGYVITALPPFTITFFSLLFAVITACTLRGRKIVYALKRLNRKQWLILFLQALLGIFLFRICITFGLRHTSAAEAGVITGSAPAITALLTYFVLREKLTWQNSLGIAGTLCGILVLQGFPFHLENFNLYHLWGNLLVLGAAACEASFTVLARKLHLGPAAGFRLHPVVQAGIVGLVALLLCLIPMLQENPWAAVNQLPRDGWLALLWYGCFGTVIAFAAMFTGAKYCNGYTIATMSGLIPLSALVLSILILGDLITAYQSVGCLLIIGSIIVMGHRGKTGGI